MTPIHDSLQTVFQTVFKNAAIQITEDTTAADIENWTSLNHMDLIQAVEKAFGISFSFREVIRMESVGDMMRLIESKRSI